MLLHTYRRNVRARSRLALSKEQFKVYRSAFFSRAAMVLAAAAVYISCGHPAVGAKGGPAGAPHISSNQTKFVPRRVVVKFRAGVSAERARNIVATSSPRGHRII